MRILFLCHRIPYPPNKGEKIRAFHQLRALSARHEVDLFTLADDPSDLAYQTDLAAFCRKVTVCRLNRYGARARALPSLFWGGPLTLPCFYSRQLHASVRSALARRAYDRIFVYSSSMAQYVDSPHGVPIITDLVDVDSDKWAQYASFARFPWSAVYRLEGRRLRDYERQVCARSWRVVVSTEREAVLARQLADPGQVHVIANGVDTDYFRPSSHRLPTALPTVTFTGDMSYFPNETAVTFFARDVLPLIRQSIPATRFLIVGRNPGKKVRQLKECGGVDVTGFVPDVRLYLAQTDVSVAPFSIAAGIQNKILESMASGLPVVATSRAVQGLAPEVAELVDTADTPAEIAAKVVSLLRDPEMAGRRGIESRNRVATVYHWEHWLDKLRKLIEGSVSNGKPRVLQSLGSSGTERYHE